MTDMRVVPGGQSVPEARPPWQQRYGILVPAVAAVLFLVVRALVDGHPAPAADDARLVPARQAVERYLDTLKIPDYHAAYGQLCFADRHTVSEAAFTDRTDKIGKYRILTVRATSAQVDTDPVAVTVAITPNWASKPRTEVISVVDEQGGWRACPDLRLAALLGAAHP